MRLQNSEFFSVFNRQTEQARGRVCLLFHNLFGNFYEYLVGGTLYTAFLTANDFSLKDVSILAFLPTMFSCAMAILAPSIWERIPRRRWLLAGCKLLFYIFYILVITFIPIWVKDQGKRVLFFGIFIILGNIFNALSTDGLAAWHVNFLPEEIRARFFTYMSAISSILGGILLLVAGIIADAIKGSPSEQTILVILRLVGFFFALLDVVVLVLPKEYPYPRSSEKTRLANIFILPFTHRPFLGVMACLSVWSFATALASTGLTYYLMNSVGVKVALINGLSFAYGFILILLSPLWRRVLYKVGWIAFFALGVFIYAPSFLAVVFLGGGNWIWLYPVMMLIQFAGNVPITLSSSQLIYLNMPPEDRTYYFSFNTVRNYAFTFLGQITASFVISSMGEQALHFAGLSLSAVPLLCIAACLLELGFALVFYRLRKRLTANPSSSI